MINTRAISAYPNRALSLFCIALYAITTDSVFWCRFRVSSAIAHTLKMATTSISSLQIAMSRSCISSSQKFADVSSVVLGAKSKAGSWNKLASACHVASVQPFQRSFTSSSVKSAKIATKAMSESSETSPISGLPINLKGCFPFFYARFNY